MLLTTKAWPSVSSRGEAYDDIRNARMGCCFDLHRHDGTEGKGSGNIGAALHEPQSAGGSAGRGPGAPDDARGEGFAARQSGARHSSPERAGVRLVERVTPWRRSERTDGVSGADRPGGDIRYC